MEKEASESIKQLNDCNAEGVLEEIKKNDIAVLQIDFDFSTHKPIQVSSYSINFTQISDPFVIIPAQPGIYRKPSLPLQLSDEPRGPSYPDYSHEFFTSYFEAMLMALHDSIDCFNIGNYDMLTDRSSLRQLFNWGTGSEAYFKVDFEKYENCLLMRRPDFVQNEPSKNLAKSFERQCTNDFNCKSDYFISEFMLGTKKVLMRFEVDAILDDSPKKRYQGSHVPFTSSPKPPFKFVELKTYSAESENSINWGKNTTWFQSYIAGVEYVVAGFKEEIDGKTYVIEIIEKSMQDPDNAPESAQQGMRRVIGLLNRIHEFMADKESGTKISLVCEKRKKGDLKITICNDKRSFIPPNYPFKSEDLN